MLKVLCWARITQKLGQVCTVNKCKLYIFFLSFSFFFSGIPLQKKKRKINIKRRKGDKKNKLDRPPIEKKPDPRSLPVIFGVPQFPGDSIARGQVPSRKASL